MKFEERKMKAWVEPLIFLAMIVLPNSSSLTLAMGIVTLGTRPLSNQEMVGMNSTERVCNWFLNIIIMLCILGSGMLLIGRP